MKVHSETYKNKLKTVREAKALIQFNNIIADEEDIFSIKLYYNCDILKSAMKVLEFDYRKNIDLNTQINCKYGIKIGEEYEYLDYGNYIVYKSELQEDTKLYHITCYDKMLYSMKNYDDVFKDVIITYPISIRDYINTIASNIGLVFKNKNQEFSNYNKTISRELYKGQEYTVRDVLDELAQVTASTICINNDDELEIRYINETNDTIDENFLKDVNVTFGKKYGPVNSIVLSRSGESDNVYLDDPESVAKNGVTEIKIIDNQIMNFNDRADYLQDILTRLDGLTYYLNDYSSPGITYYDLCDRYNVKIGENTYSCVMLNDEINITQGLEENVYTEMPKLTETDYTKADKTDRKINQTYLIVDKQNQEITALASKTDNLETKTAQLRLDVDKIEGQISDIADITTTAEGVGILVMNNINESEPIYIKIYPVLGDITSLYPADNVFPSDELYPLGKTLLFHCTSEEYDKTFELPKDLLWLNKDVYDEFVLDYDNQACYILHRVGVLEDGTKYALTNSIQENLEYPTIRLINGDYEVSLVGQPNAYLYVRLMVQNIYTTQFATKVEMNSKIKQTKDEIDLEVSRKVGNDEVISRINQTPEAITIQANKVNIGGVITAINNNTTTTIDGNKITTGSITASKVASDVITTNNFSAQKINADNIKAGTLSAGAISLQGTYLSPNSSTVGGWDVSGDKFSSSNSTGNSTINSNGEIYFYPTQGGILALNDAFRCKGPAGIAIYNSHTKYGNSTYIDDGISLCADEGHLNLMNESSSYGVNIRSYCSPNTISNAGERSIRLAAGQNIAMYAVGGYCYAEGANVSSSKIKTANGSASSKNVKKNFKEFDNKKYERAINLLKDMKLYEYDYKYDLYKNRHQYGFIIDELQKLNGNEFFDFEEEEAIVKGEHLDFNLDSKSTDDETIKVKSYNSDVLDKYLLTVVKGLLAKIEILEQKVLDLENNQKSDIINESEGDI